MDKRKVTPEIAHAFFAFRQNVISLQQIQFRITRDTSFDFRNRLSGMFRCAITDCAL